MFEHEPDLKMGVQIWDSIPPNTYGPKTVYFLAVLRRYRDLSADIFGSKQDTDKRKQDSSTTKDRYSIKIW